MATVAQVTTHIEGKMVGKIFVEGKGKRAVPCLLTRYVQPKASMAQVEARR